MTNSREEPFRVHIQAAPRSYLGRLDRQRQLEVRQRIEELRSDPFDRELSKPLHGRLQGLRSSRVGNRRTLFEVLREICLVEITDIGPRGDIDKQ